MLILTLPIGLYETNCYMIIENESATVIDPAGNPEFIIKTAEDNGAKISEILLTHGHLDHTLGCAGLMKACCCRLYMHEADYPMIADIDCAYPREKIMLSRFEPIKQCGSDENGENILFVKDGDRIGAIDVIESPGHTMGSVMYRLCTENVIFTGDTVFNMSVGICDTQNDYLTLLKSVERLKSIEGDYTLCPGHGPQTLLSYEKNKNPYFRNSS